MSEASDDPRLDSIERGLDALFATEVTREILEAVDVEAILADEPATDPVDVERLANAVGRVLAHRVIDGSGATGFAKRTVGTRVGGRVAAETVRLAAENVDPQEVADALVEIDEGTPGPQLRKVIQPVVEDVDLPVYEIIGPDERDVTEIDVGGETQDPDTPGGGTDGPSSEGSDESTPD